MLPNKGQEELTTVIVGVGGAVNENENEISSIAKSLPLPPIALFDNIKSISDEVAVNAKPY